MPPKNQKLYNYKAEQMEKALNAVRNEQQSIRKAAQIFNVPRTTLNDKVLGKTSDGRKHVNNTDKYAVLIKKIPINTNQNPQNYR